MYLLSEKNGKENDFMKKRRYTMLMKSCAVLCAALLAVPGTGYVPVRAEETVGVQQGDETAVKADPAEDDKMNQILANLTREGSDYSQLKRLYESGELGGVMKLTESCEGNRINITAEIPDKSSEYYESNKNSEGSWDFVLDGDYITYAVSGNDLMGVFMFSYAADAILEYLGVDTELGQGIILTTSVERIKTDYYSEESDAESGKKIFKMYVGGTWDIDTALDNIYLDKSLLADTYGMRPLEAEDTNWNVNIGKLRGYVFGNKDSVDISVAEYGGRSNLTFRSIISLVNVLKPAGYEAFIKNYTSLQTISSDAYQVAFPDNREEVPDVFRELKEGYQITNIHFSSKESETTPTQDPETEQNISLKDSDVGITGLKKNYVYTGKMIRPKIKVTCDGLLLKAGRDYELSWSSNKKVGTAAVKIVGKGAYFGTITKKFKILPKKTKLSTAKKSGGKLIVSWKGQKKQVSGYEISYSTGKKFKAGNTKTVLIKKYRTTKKTIPNVKTGKSVYVRIRTYKIVGKKKYFSSWSALKKAV